MIFNVPQYIDTEDKIVGPLTAKKLLWLFVMCALLLTLWSLLELGAFIAIAIPVVIIFLALAFYRPYNQSLYKFITSTGIFVFKPKVFIWRRDGDDEKKSESRAKIEIIHKKVFIVVGGVPH